MKKTNIQLKLLKSIRKKMPKPTRVIPHKKYVRKDRSWEKDI